MNPNGSKTPLFLFHGDYLGGGIYAARLANLLGADQPLYAIAPHDLGQAPLTLTIEEIAADRLRLILEARPKGPYRLYGYCFAGLVAFEVARLLIAAGEKVEMVGMIDTPTTSARRYVQLLLAAMRGTRPIAGPVVDRAAPLVWNKISKLDRPVRFSNAQRFASMSRKARGRLVGQRDGLPLTAAADQQKIPNLAQSRLGQIFRRDFEEWPSAVEAMSAYSPKPLSVPVIYFAAEYGVEPWRRISPDIEIIKLSGSHGDAVRDLANLAKIAGTVMS
jgi:thioesterase domain-containing protein